MSTVLAHDKVKRKLMVVALLLPFALLIWIWIRAVDRAARNSQQIYDAIRIGMPINDIQIFSADVLAVPGKTDFVICMAQNNGPLLRRDGWRKLAESASGFPPACRTILIHMRGALYLPGNETFDLEFDKSWKVFKIGEKRTRLKG